MCSTTYYCTDHPQWSEILGCHSEPDIFALLSVCILQYNESTKVQNARLGSPRLGEDYKIYFATVLIMAFIWLQLLFNRNCTIINVEVKLASKNTSITTDNVTIEESK